MKAIRRSMKRDTADSKQSQPHNSLSSKSAFAILPPKKVIKALYDYTPDPSNTRELGFQKGDFFHVIERENDENWYEACNPLVPNARGLVPVAYFEVIGKTERGSSGGASSSSYGSGPSAINSSLHTPPISHSATMGGNMRNVSSPITPGSISAPIRTASPTSNPMGTNGIQRLSSIGLGKGAMVYGIVQYDFKAERVDELGALRGEPIIVIAQSNPEWYVAKPIGRLGGPGLIPVAFVEIRDLTTGAAVADQKEAIRAAGVPRVEEWKRLAADYKNSSITLGKFESSPPMIEQPFTPVNGSLGLDRLQIGNGLARNGSPAQAGHTPSRQNPPVPESPLVLPQALSGRGLVAPVSAHIPRYCFENEKYWYIIECELEDGTHWELSRYYQNFYDFQISLLAAFPTEAGRADKPRILPYMPGPVTYVTDAISNGRRESLNDYLKKLLALPNYISKCRLVCELFQPREGDHELDPQAVKEDYRLSAGSTGSGLNGTDGVRDDDGTPTETPYSSVTTTSTSPPKAHPAYANGKYDGQVAPSELSAHSYGHSQDQTRSQPDYHEIPELDTGISHSSTLSPQTYSPQVPSHSPVVGQQNYHSSQQQYHQTQPQGAYRPVPSAATAPPAAALKIKVCFNDDLIAMRVPANISFVQLRDKISDRFKVTHPDLLILNYKEEGQDEYIEIMDDDGWQAIKGSQRLLLYVGYA